MFCCHLNIASKQFLNKLKKISLNQQKLHLFTRKKILNPKKSIDEQVFFLYFQKFVKG